MRGLNDGTYYALQKFANDTPRWRGVILSLDALGGVVVMSLLAALLIGWLMARRNIRAAVAVAAVCLLGTLIVYLANIWIGDPGPPESDEAYAGVKLGP